MYQRPMNESKLTKSEKQDLLKTYNEHYRSLTAANQNCLRQKVPREIFQDLLDEVGEIIQKKSLTLASKREGREFLDSNPLPDNLTKRLPDDFRVFCLALNAVKQWIAAEQAATDRYLLGGNSRDLCRDAAERCLVTGELLGPDRELHHPVRDGRPPIPLSKEGHARIEGQLAQSKEQSEDADSALMR